MQQLVGGGCLVLTLISVARYVRDLSSRARAEKFARDFRLEVRRPLEVSMMRLVSAGDLAAGIAVDVALRDSEETPSTDGVSPRTESVQPEWSSLRKDEFRAARDLMLDAVAARPGWAYHRFLLGRVAFAASHDSPASKSHPSADLWAEPLQTAAHDAPGVDIIWEVLANDCLERWSELNSTLRAEYPSVLRRAFLDPEFVTRDLVVATRVLGKDATVRLLPEAPKILEAAAKQLAQAGDIDAAAQLIARRETAERKQRIVDLERIEQRYRLQDLDGLEKACALWVWDHPVGEFDDPIGRSQVARVLAMWPNDRVGSWRGDPRAQLVRFFLAGREADVPPEALARAVEPLSGVPETVTARVRLLMGDVEGANDLSLDSGTEGSLDWTPYFLALSRHELLQGKPVLARAALAHVSSGAREECDLLLARRDVARALEDQKEIQAVQQALERVQSAFDPQQAWSSKGALSICLDPERAAARLLTVELVAGKPAIVSYGWDGGRLGTLFVREKRILSVPFQGLSGRRTFAIETVLGGRVHVSDTTIGPS